jgi:polyisoprenoid-binding protein YceI
MNKLKAILFVILLILFSYDIKAQQQTVFSEASGTIINLEGTSTLHGWDMESTDTEISASFHMEEGEIQDLNSLSFKLPVRSLTSGRSNLDRNAYDAVKANQYPDILFTMNDAEVTAIEQETYRVDIQGMLTIAGVTNEANLEATCSQNGENLVCAGDKEINMTDFGIEPPTFMLGTMRVGEIVNINFTVNLEREQIHVSEPSDR